MGKIDDMARDIALAAAAAGTVAQGVQTVQTVVAAAVPVAPDTGKVLTPMDQMNKPVKGAQANFAVGGGLGAALLIISQMGWMPEKLNTPESQLAIGILVSWLSGLVAGAVATYKARDKRFATVASDA